MITQQIYEDLHKTLSERGIVLPKMRFVLQKGISDPLLKWKAIEVAHALSTSPNTKIAVPGDKSGLPTIQNDHTGK